LFSDPVTPNRNRAGPGPVYRNDPGLGMDRAAARIAAPPRDRVPVRQSGEFAAEAGRGGVAVIEAAGPVELTAGECVAG